MDRSRLTGATVATTTAGRRLDWRFWGPVAAATATGLVVRLLHLSEVSRTPALGGDPFWYHGVANLLANGRGVVNPYEYLDLGTLSQTADHPPLLSLYLAGWSWFGLDSVDAHRLATVLLGTLTIVVGAVAGRLIGGRRLGVVAAALLAIYPNIWRHDGTVQAETPAVLATVAVIWLAYRYLDSPSAWRLAAVSATVALGALARPELLLLALLVVVPLALRASRAADRRPLALVGRGGSGQHGGARAVGRVQRGPIR